MKMLNLFWHLLINIIFIDLLNTLLHVKYTLKKYVEQHLSFVADLQTLSVISLILYEIHVQTD
jgi:hypothetical protein